MGKLNWKAPHRIVAIVALISFFLPWINVMGVIQISGYNLVNALQGLAQLGSEFTGETVSTTQYYLIFLYPILALAIILKQKRAKWMEFAAGGMLIFNLVYASTKLDSEMITSESMQYISFGFYAFILSNLALFLTPIISDKEEESSVEVVEAEPAV